MTNFINKLGGVFRRAQVPKEYYTTVEAVLDLESQLSLLNENQIKERISVLRQNIVKILLTNL